MVNISIYRENQNLTSKTHTRIVSSKQGAAFYSTKPD